MRDRNVAHQQAKWPIADERRYCRPARSIWAKADSERRCRRCGGVQIRKQSPPAITTAASEAAHAAVTRRLRDGYATVALPTGGGCSRPSQVQCRVDYPQSFWVARAAPSVRASSLAHMMDGWTRGVNAPWEKPQSLPARTFSRPTMRA